MYSASSQNYNNYDYRYYKGLTVSFVFNCLFCFFIFTTFGSVFGNIVTPETKKSHTISIKGYNIINTSQEIVSEKKEILEEKTHDIKNKKPEDVVETKKEIVPEKAKEVSNNGTKKIDKKTEVLKEKPQNQTPILKQNNTNNTIPPNTNSAAQVASEPSHFGMQNPHPDYPVMSFQKNENGSVTIEYTVKADGTIGDVVIADSSGFQRLDNTAIMTFKKWKFKPALSIAGVAMDSLPKRITFVFDIRTQTIKEEEV